MIRGYPSVSWVVGSKVATKVSTKVGWEVEGPRVAPAEFPPGHGKMDRDSRDIVTSADLPRLRNSESRDKAVTKP